MKRKIIKIDQEKCNGCTLCVSACHEGAIGMVDGKAKLLRDDYCDGLGDCLPVCPTGAITFEEREAADYDEAAVLANMAKKESGTANFHNQGHQINEPHQEVKAPPHGGCPGMRAKFIEHKNEEMANKKDEEVTNGQVREVSSQLRQWPVQIKLVPINAPYFKNANLLIAADCAAYSYGDFHTKFMKNKVTIIGCPKLDMGDYSEKLTEILRSNDIKSVTVVRMEVPCCGGIEHAVKTALKNSDKMIPWQVVTLSVDGKIIED